MLALTLAAAVVNAAAASTPPGTVTTTKVAQPAILGVPGSSSGRTRTAPAMSTRIAMMTGSGPRWRGSAGGATRGVVVASPHR